MTAFGRKDNLESAQWFFNIIGSYL